MCENEDKNNSIFSETVDNIAPEGAEYDVFSENTAKNKIEDEQINRDYLNHIYKEDMSFLNKDVRMTRMRYLQDRDRIEEHFRKEKNNFIQAFILITVVLFVALGVGIWALHEWYTCWKLYQAVNAGMYLTGLEVTGKELRGIWAMTGFYGCIGWISVFLGTAQFCFFGRGYYKKIKHLTREKHKSLETLEFRKKEAMLLGQYDSVK